MQQIITIEEFRAKDISEDLWGKLTVLINEVKKVSDPQEPEKTVENIKANYLYFPEHLGLRVLVATENGKEYPSGLAQLLYDEGALADVTFVRMFVPSSSSQSQVYKKLACMVHEAASESGRSLIMFESLSAMPATEQFLSGIGAEKKQEMNEVRLFLKDIDWSMVYEWSKNVPQDFSIEIYHSPVPEENVPEAIDLIDLGMNQMPHDNLDVQASRTSYEKYRAFEVSSQRSGGGIYTIIARHKSGKAAGLTIISYKPDVVPYILFQLMTVVRPEFRGNGLGRLIKAQMLEHLRGRHPKALWISTDNAATNASMRRINEELGFRVYKTINYWQMPVEKLGSYLKEVENDRT